MTLSCCRTTDSRVIAAAETKGRVEAKVSLPDQPKECPRHMERYKPQTGDKNWVIQAHWEINADAIDRQIDDCAAFNSDLKTKMENQ